MKTDVREFDKWLSCLPEFVKSNLWLIPLDGLAKEPAKHIFSTTDKKYAITIEQARERLRNNMNVAVMMSGVKDTLCALDNDALNKVNTGKLTLTVFTSNGKLHEYYINDGTIENAATTGISEIGSVRAKNYYTVCPGSFVKPVKKKLHDMTLLNVAGLYTVINQVPLVELNFSDLPKALLPSSFGNELVDSVELHTTTQEIGNQISTFGIMEMGSKNKKNNCDIDFKNKHGRTLRNIRLKDKKMNLLLTESHPRGYLSVSEVDIATVVKLMIYEFNDDDILSILKTYRYRDKLDREDYITITFERANAFIESTEKTTKILEMRGYKGILLPNDLFMAITYRKPDGWSFRVFDLNKGWESLSSWVTVKKLSSLFSRGDAWKIRELFQKSFGNNDFHNVMDDMISVVQDNRFEWIVKQTEQNTTEEPDFSDEHILLATNILTNEDPFVYIQEQAKKIHAGDSELLVFEWTSALSGTLCEIPINLWTIGASGKGKSHSKYTVILLLPKDSYAVFTSASPRSFFYYILEHGEYSLDKILLFIDETEASTYTLPMLRSLTSQTPILPRHLSVNEAKLLDLKILGKRSVWFTSVKTFGGVQIKNRFIHVNPDETIEQDDMVFNTQDMNYRQKKKEEHDFSVARAMGHILIRDTTELNVFIPYRIKWPFKGRRYLYPLFLSTIKTVCKIRYRKRDIDEDGYLVATPGDFEMAKYLWDSFEDTIAKRVTGWALVVLDQLSNSDLNGKTHSQISSEITLGTRQIHNICEELLEEGLVSRQKRRGEKGSPPWEYWKLPQVKINDIAIIKEEN